MRLGKERLAGFFGIVAALILALLLVDPTHAGTEARPYLYAADGDAGFFPLAAISLSATPPAGSHGGGPPTPWRVAGFGFSAFAPERYG